MATNRAISGTRTVTEADLIGTRFKTWRGQLEADMRVDLKVYTALDESRLPLPRVADIRIGATLYEGHRAPHYPLFVETPWNGRSTLDSRGLSAVDIAAIAEDARRIMESVSPIDTGHYRRSFAFVVKGRLTQTLPRPLGATVVGVANTAPYASTLDSARATGPRPFVLGMAWLRGHPDRRSFDARLGPYLSNQAAVETTPGRGGKPLAYTVPVLWIGQLNSLTQRGVKRSRRNRTR